jgi:uncharacterized protein
MKNEKVVELDLENFGKLTDDQRLRQYPLWTAVTAGTDPEFALQLAQKSVDKWRAVDELACIYEAHNITPLAMASAVQLPAFLKLVIAEGADINAMDSLGSVPLTYALQGENLDNFRFLIEEGANPDPLEDGVGRYSPLAMAADHGLYEAVKELINLQVNVNWTNENGTDALRFAAANGEIECVELLLNAGANPASFDNEGFSAIHNAVDRHHSDVVEKLLDAGVDVDLRIESPVSSIDDGTTPLHRASAMLDLELVNMLVERGADINAVSTESLTPLACVFQFGDEEDDAELIQYLIEHGAKK